MELSPQLELQELAGLPVVVAGDFMLDEYLWGQVERISPEAPVQVVEVRRETRVLGGAGNVVNNLCGLGARVAVLGLVGADATAELLRAELQRLGVEAGGLLVDPQRPTTRKTRILGGRQQMLRLDWEQRTPAPSWFQDKALQYLQQLPTPAALILSDYGKGVLTPALLAALIAYGRERGIPVVVDPKGQDFRRYRGATIITPNRKEAAVAVGYPLPNLAELVRAGRELNDLCATTAILITLGPEGMLLVPREGEPELIPAQAREVFDVSGAGDTVVAVLTLALARWGDLKLAATLANLAAGIVVGKVGTAPIRAAELAAALAGRPGTSKIIPLRELPALAVQLRAQGRRLVFTNGCFDLLHWGHLRFLEASRALGDVLLVALDDDLSVRRLKGPGRPVLPAWQRQEILAALRAVDYVTVFATEELPWLLQVLQPAILTKGSNYPEEKVVGAELVRSWGGRVVLIPIEDPISVSQLIEQIQQQGENNPEKCARGETETYGSAN